VLEYSFLHDNPFYEHFKLNRNGLQCSTGVYCEQIHIGCRPPRPTRPKSCEVCPPVGTAKWRIRERLRIRYVTLLTTYATPQTRPFYLAWLRNR
jgi:hypothetical protein